MLSQTDRRSMWFQALLSRLRSRRPHPQSVGTAAFGVLTLVMILLAAICLKDAIGWIDKPFAGFLFYEFAGVGSIGDYEWPGTQAGVHYRDMILEVNSQKVFSGRDILNVIETIPVGEQVRYLFSRGGKPITLDIPVSVFGLRDFFRTFGFTYFLAVVFWVIGVIVYVLKRNTLTTWVFFLYCFFLGTYLITGFQMQSTTYRTWSYHVDMVSLAFFPATMLHLSLVFPERTQLVRRWPRLPVAFYALSCALAVCHSMLFVMLTGSARQTDLFVQNTFYLTLPVLFNRVFAVVGAAALVAFSGYAYWRSLSVITRQRARVILLSSAVAFVPPTVIQALIAFGDLAMPFNVSAITILIFPAAIGFAIARHNLFDVDVYIKRTVGYVIMTAVVGLTYFSVQTIFSTFVLKPVFGAHAEALYPIVFALLVVFFFNPVNRRVQEGVEKLFFRKPYDYKATVASIGDALTSLLNLDAIITKVLYTVRERMFLDKAGVILLDPARRECHTLIVEDAPASAPGLTQSLCLSYDDPLLALLAQEKKLITKYDIAEDPRYAVVRESCGKAFSDLGASLAMPLLHQNTFAGVLTLGYKKSGHFYSRDDIDLLKTISTMTATAIQQAREKEQRGTLMQLFSKHVSPEVADSLWNQRDQFLDGGRPRSQKVPVTVLFTDLQGFTAVSEKMDPQVLMDWLNTYMESIAKTVMEHGGVVDDYFGDGVKVNFGVPLPRTSEAEIRQDAVNAVTCALALEQEMVRLNAVMKERDLPTLRMRVGIFTGPVVAGSLGSADRMKYTTLGDTVNTASRLESFDKDLTLPHLETSPCRILIGETTLHYLGDQFQTQRVGELTLKGKDEKITAYCVLGRQDGVKPVTDLRKAPRVSVEATVGLSGDKVTLQAQVNDLSACGVSVCGLSLRLDKGEFIQVRLPRPKGDQPLILNAKVAWSVEDRAGVMFLDLMAEDRTALEQFMARRGSALPELS